MGKYLSRVSKVVDEKKNQKALKADRDARVYEPSDKDQEVFYQMAHWKAVVKV